MRTLACAFDIGAGQTMMYDDLLEWSTKVHIREQKILASYSANNISPTISEALMLHFIMAEVRSLVLISTASYCAYQCYSA